MSADLIERLRAATAESGWAVVNTETDGIVIWFGNRREFNTEGKARKWLEEHAATHRRHEVRPYVDPCIEHEAADELSRLRDEVAALKEQVKDAERYRWLSDRFLGGDFEWGEESTPVLLIQFDGDGIWGSLDLTVDAAIAAAAGLPAQEGK